MNKPVIHIQYINTCLGILVLYTFLNKTNHNKYQLMHEHINKYEMKMQPKPHTWCGRKVMRLATLCTNRQCCCLPLHMAVRLTPAVDLVQVLTCCICYAIVESV